jgi:hypothetical protein
MVAGCSIQLVLGPSSASAGSRRIVVRRRNTCTDGWLQIGQRSTQDGLDEMTTTATMPEALLRRKQETMIAVSAPIDADTLRIRHEFLAMPGMCLPVPQAARLLGVSLNHAAEMLDVLEEEGFLIRTPDGQYRRALPLMA